MTKDSCPLCYVICKVMIYTRCDMSARLQRGVCALTIYGDARSKGPVHVTHIHFNVNAACLCIFFLYLQHRKNKHGASSKKLILATKGS